MMFKSNIDGAMFNKIGTGEWHTSLSPEFMAWLSEGNMPEPADLPNPNELLLAQIAAMEQSDLTNRGSRELMLRLMQKEGASIGMTEDQLILAVPFYRKLKARDAEITALRRQIT